MAVNYWLMKSEPDEFSITDLKNKPNQAEHWDGVRNYQSSNFMRDKMKINDRVLFYHSGVNFHPKDDPEVFITYGLTPTASLLSRARAGELRLRP